MSFIEQRIDALPPPGGTRLITNRLEPELLAAYRETDAEDALLRGLQEYAEQLSIDWPGGEQVRFRIVTADWAEQNQDIQFPALAIRAAEPLTYGDECGDDAIYTFPGNIQVMRVTQCKLNVIVEGWCTNAEQRRAVIAMLEDAWNPVDWMYGFRLVLPHYFNAVSSWSAWDIERQDTEEDRSRNFVKFTQRLAGYVRQYRVLGPGVRMQTKVQKSIGPGVVIPSGSDD